MLSSDQFRSREPRTKIPSTLHDSLVSRLDQLGSARNVAQTASVLGRQFSSELLFQVVSEEKTAIESALTQLVKAMICTRRGSGEDAVYQFRHALIQDAAYQSMLRSKRKAEHLKIAEVLEGVFPDTAKTEPEVLAHHFTEAGETDKAIVYWQRAGNQARERFDNHEAVNNFRTALKLLSRTESSLERTQKELGLLVSLGLPLTTIKGYGSEEVGEVYGRARDITLAGGTDTRLFPILHGLYRFYFVRGELTAAEEVASRLLTLAEAGGDISHFLEAHRALGFTLSMLGRTREAREHLERAIELYDAERHSQHIAIYGTDPQSQVARMGQRPYFGARAITLSHEAGWMKP